MFARYQPFSAHFWHTDLTRLSRDWYSTSGSPNSSGRSNSRYDGCKTLSTIESNSRSSSVVRGQRGDANLLILISALAKAGLRPVCTHTRRIIQMPFYRNNFSPVLLFQRGFRSSVRPLFLEYPLTLSLVHLTSGRSGQRRRRTQNWARVEDCDRSPSPFWWFATPVSYFVFLRFSVLLYFLCSAPLDGIST